MMDALWPEAEGNLTRVALASALHRLRGTPRAVSKQSSVRRGSSASIPNSAGWTSGRWSACWNARRPRPRPRELTRKAASLYRGAFLEQREAELPPATALAQSLRRRLLRQLVVLRRAWDQALLRGRRAWIANNFRHSREHLWGFFRFYDFLSPAQALRRGVDTSSGFRTAISGPSSPSPPPQEKPGGLICVFQVQLSHRSSSPGSDLARAGAAG